MESHSERYHGKRQFDLHITAEEFDNITLTSGLPNSPMFREACAALGISPSRDLKPKFFDDFHEPGIDPELQKIRAEHYESKRHDMLRNVITKRKQLVDEEEKSWRQMKIEEDENMLATGDYTSAQSPSKGSITGAVVDSELISREQRQLEKIRLRQQQELEQMLSYELKVAMMRKQNEDKLERERMLKEKQLREREAKQKRWDKQKRQQELERKQRERELEVERRRLAEKMHRVAKAQAQREKEAEDKRKREAQEKELERMRRKEELEAQTQAILKEQQRQVELKKAEMERRDAERKRALEQRRRQLAREQAAKRKQQRDRVESAKANHHYILDKQREDFAQRQKHAQDRQLRFQEEQALQQEKLRQQALAKAEEIQRTKEQMERIQRQKRENIRAHEKRINDRMLQREMEAKRLAKINRKLQHDKDMERKMAYDQMQKNLDSKKKKILDNRAAKQAIAEKRHKERHKSNAVQEELRRLREQDRKDALARKKKRDEYEKAKILKKIEDDNMRTKELKRQRDVLFKKREEFRRKAEEDRERVLKQFESVKKTGNLDATKKMFSKLGIDPSAMGDNASPMSSRSTKPTRTPLSPTEHGRKKSPTRPKSAGTQRRKGSPRKQNNNSGDSSLGTYDPRETVPDGFGGGKSSRTAKTKPKREGKQKQKRKRGASAKRRGPSKAKDVLSTVEDESKPTENKEQIEKMQQIEALRKKQNQELLALLETEQAEEERREKVYSGISDAKELRRLEKAFGVERAQASARIMQKAENHERALKSLMESLKIDL